MSTKIYNAYICRHGMAHLHATINKIRKTYWDYLATELEQIPKKHIKKVLNAYEDDYIIVYPLWEDKTLFQIFSESFRPNLELLDGIEDYHYQNQADPWYEYENYTDEEKKKFAVEYEQREKDWGVVFRKSWTPAEAGYSIPLLSDKVKFIYGRDY